MKSYNDIDEQALAICGIRAKSLSNYHLRFAKYDITKEKVEPARYDVVTCMIGTINHLPIEQWPFVFRQLHDTLKPGSLLIFSSWNPACDYTTFLHFYSRQFRDALKERSSAAESLYGLLDHTNFMVESVNHFCFLPDICYESWESELSLAKASEALPQTAKCSGGKPDSF